MNLTFLFFIFLCSLLLWCDGVSTNDTLLIEFVFKQNSSTVSPYVNKILYTPVTCCYLHMSLINTRHRRRWTKIRICINIMYLMPNGRIPKAERIDLVGMIIWKIIVTVKTSNITSCTLYFIVVWFCINSPHCSLVLNMICVTIGTLSRKRHTWSGFCVMVS